MDVESISLIQDSREEHYKYKSSNVNNQTLQLFSEDGD